MEASQGDTSEREITERDTTAEWRIQPSRTPATVAELEGRIEVAMSTAKSAEEAALEIGAASLEAAEQARRAAALAERASAAASRAAEAAATAVRPPVVGPSAPVLTSTTPARADSGAAQPDRPTRDFVPRPNGADPRRPDPFEERITAFRLRAEKVMIRLQKLEVGAAPGDGLSEVVRLR